MVPDRSQPGTWDSLAVRVRTLEERAEEDRRMTARMIDDLRCERERAAQQLQDTLRRDYLTRDQIAVLYASRAEGQRSSSWRREWLVAVAAVAATIAVILQAIQGIH